MTMLDMTIVGPLLILAVAALAMLMVGAFTQSGRSVAALGGVGLLATAGVMLFAPALGAVGVVGEGSPLLFVTPFSHMVGLMMVLVTALAVPLFVDHFRGKACKPELFVLMMLSLVGAFVLVQASHMLTMYMGLELMSFPLYILAAFVRNDAKSSEAGLKYFVLGGLASGLMLFGIALLYAATGKLGFVGLHAQLAMGAMTPLVLVGAAFVLVGALFKLSVVPFHMWTPDVYEGAPTPVTALMASLPKIAAFALLMRLLAGPFAGFTAQWQMALAVLAGAGMLLGAVVAVVQQNIKRLLAWSTIANVGFMLAGIVAASAQGNAAVLFYVFVYAVTSVGLFAGILLAYAETLPDLKGLATRAPWLAAGLLVNLFSLAGVPPLAGFMAKLDVFMAAVKAGYVGLAVVGVLASVVACFYSLYLIKVMYFEAPATAAPLLNRRGLEVALGLSVLVNVLLGVFPTVLSDVTAAVGGMVF